MFYLNNLSVVRLAYITTKTSSNGNCFRVTGPLCGEFTGRQWIPLTKASDASVFFDLRLNKRLSKQSWGWWFDTPSRSLLRHCNANDSSECVRCATPDTVKPVCNDHLYNTIYYLWFIQKCVSMITEGTNLLLLTISALWSSSRWPLAT